MDKKQKHTLRAAPRTSLLDDIDGKLLPFARTTEVIERSTKVGYNWESAVERFVKLREEMDELAVELRAAKKNKPNTKKILDELGDVYFALLNVTHALAVVPEKAVAGACKKYEKRFRAMEKELTRKGLTMEKASFVQQKAAWNTIKKEMRPKRKGAN